MSPRTAQRILSEMPPLNTLKTRHALHLYKIHYKTLAPSGHDPYQHGTRIERQDVPSNMRGKDLLQTALFGSHGGYMVVMPDYLGQGDNELTLHPYIQADTLAQSSIDMLLASKALAAILNYPLNDKLFLTGYSEGGFSTMVMVEALLKNHPQLKITAAALGSAPYDWHECMHFVMLESGERATVYAAYFFYAMQTYRHYWQNLSDIFIPPYDTLVPVLFDGNHTLQEVLDILPKNPRDIFVPAFFNGIMDETDPRTVELKKNFNHYDFVAKEPLLLVGTKGDRDVPYHGAEMAYAFLRAKSDLVTIQSVSDTLDHVQAHPYVLKEVLAFFQQYDL